MKNLFYLLAIIPGLFISCTNNAQVPDIIPTHDSFSMHSSILNENRNINVWVPASYNQSQNPLPVLYMADGGTKEDFPHIANTLDSLINAKAIPAFILVGIENTQRRKDLSGETTVEKDKEIAPVIGGSANFRKFINDELMPAINNKYRTTNIKGILGESLSGLFVMETFFLAPEMFDYYIAFDPSLWWNDRYLAKNASSFINRIESPKVLWFAGSKAKDIQLGTSLLEENLAKNNNAQLIWKYSNEPKEKHHTIFRATKVKAFIWTLNNIINK